jgi:hypothetical protein
MLTSGIDFFQDEETVAVPPAWAATSPWSWRAPQVPQGASPTRLWSWSQQEHRPRQLGERPEWDNTLRAVAQGQTTETKGTLTEGPGLTSCCVY